MTSPSVHRETDRKAEHTHGLTLPPAGDLRFNEITVVLKRPAAVGGRTEKQWRENSTLSRTCVSDQSVRHPIIIQEDLQCVYLLTSLKAALKAGGIV